MIREELIRARDNKTQQEVAQNLDITQKHMSKIERGQRTPSLKVACKISKYYNISMDKLFPDLFY